MKWRENRENLPYEPVHAKVRKKLVRNPEKVLYDIVAAAEEEGLLWEDHHTHGQSQKLLEMWLDIPEHRDIIERIDKWAVKFNQSTFKLRINCFQAARLTQYIGGAGYHGWHSDYVTRQPAKLAYVLLLEAPEKGGDLHLFGHNDGDPVPLEPGDLVVFPAFHPHRVTRVTKGQRTALTGWYGGPPLQ